MVEIELSTFYNKIQSCKEIIAQIKYIAAKSAYTRCCKKV